MSDKIRRKETTCIDSSLLKSDIFTPAALSETTGLLTAWCRVLLEKLTGLQLVKKFPRISRNPKLHYRTHKRPPSVSILGQPNPVHIPTSHLLEIHLNIIHPSTPRFPLWYLSLRLPHQDPIQHLSSPIRATCHNRQVQYL